MRLDDFYKALKADPELVPFDLVYADQPDERIAVVKCLRDGQYVKFKLPVIIENDWETLRALALGELELQPLDVVTRIVGYFSSVSRWNDGKLTELKHRREGDYEIPHEVHIK